MAGFITCELKILCTLLPLPCSSTLIVWQMISRIFISMTIPRIIFSLKQTEMRTEPSKDQSTEGGILYVKGNSPVGPFTLCPDMINKYRERREDRLIEGVTVIKVGTNVMMYYGSGDYSGAYKTSDMKQWVRITDQMTLPNRYMHGTVIQISEKEARRLLAQ